MPSFPRWWKHLGSARSSLTAWLASTRSVACCSSPGWVTVPWVMCICCVSQPTCPRSAGTFPAFRARVWRPAVVAAGLDGLRIHDLRHTAVALWIAAGANPEEVAARAGHSSVSFTLDRYGHLYLEADSA